MINNINKKNDSIIYKDICKHFDNNKPKQIHLYCNKLDKPSYIDAIKLLEFLNKTKINVINNIFIGNLRLKNKNHHDVQFPNHDHKYYINKLINKITKTK